MEFFAHGLEQSARDTHDQIAALLVVQAELKDQFRTSRLRADSALKLVEVALARPSFTARQVEADLGISYGRFNGVIAQLVELGVLEPARQAATYQRRFRAPRVHEVLLGDRGSTST